ERRGIAHPLCAGCYGSRLSRLRWCDAAGRPRDAELRGRVGAPERSEQVSTRVGPARPGGRASLTRHRVLATASVWAALLAGCETIKTQTDALDLLRRCTGK